MKVLLDECVTDDLVSDLRSNGIVVETVEDRGWKGIKNGKLLNLAQAEYDVFVSIDRGIPFQQNYRKYDLAFVIVRIPDSRTETVRQFAREIRVAIPNCKPGEVIWIPEPPKNWPTRITPSAASKSRKRHS